MLKVMTFNIKNNYHREVKNGKISKRLKDVFEIIEKENPDILGLQEVTSEVKKIISDNFTDYNIIGRSRYNNGKISDEYNIIMIKKSFPIIASTTYSLGKDINKIGSKGLLDVFPRICTYAKVKCEGSEINVYNTHLDHLLSYNRKKQLQVLENIIKPIENEPIIIMGDLNMCRGNKILKIFLDKNYINATDKLTTPTFGNRYIDHILINNKLVLKETYINHHENYPSDHFPIIVKARLK